MALYLDHLLPTSSIPSGCEVYLSYHKIFTDQISRNVRRPFVLPYNFFSAIGLLLYLCIPHKQNPIIYAARWPVVASILWFELRLIKETSGAGMILGYLDGLISVYIIMLSWTWLIFKRPQWDAKRIERSLVREALGTKKAQTTKETPLNENLLQRKRVNGFAAVSKVHHSDFWKTDGGTCTYKYFWQPYPDTLKERISWVIDLLTSFRGVGWNFSISSNPPLDPEVLSKLEGLHFLDSNSKINSTRTKQNDIQNERLLPLVYQFLFCYLAVDILSILMMKDPYFKLGPNNYELSFFLQSLHPFILQIYRLTMASITLILGMQMSSTAIKIFISYVLGPRILGFRAQPFYFPGLWGDFHHILRKGLGGLWGGFWHQLFRIHFTAPTEYLVREGYIKSDHYTTKIFGLFTAFGISGLLHGAGSMTSITNSRPLDSVIFFILQAVGITIQVVLASLLHPFITKLPCSVRYTGNILYTLSWFYLIGWIASDDFARSGFWLLEPTPFSLLKKLGLREADSCYTIWRLFNIRWHTGNHWWESGIGFF